MDYKEICTVLEMHTSFEVYFDYDEFAFHVTDGTNDTVIGYGDDDFELLCTNFDIVISEMGV